MSVRGIQCVIAAMMMAWPTLFLGACGKGKKETSIRPDETAVVVDQLNASAEAGKSLPPSNMAGAGLAEQAGEKAGDEAPQAGGSEGCAPKEFHLSVQRDRKDQCVESTITVRQLVNSIDKIESLRLNLISYLACHAIQEGNESSCAYLESAGDMTHQRTCVWLARYWGVLNRALNEKRGCSPSELQALCEVWPGLSEDCTGYHKTTCSALSKGEPALCSGLSGSEGAKDSEQAAVLCRETVETFHEVRKSSREALTAMNPDTEEGFFRPMFLMFGMLRYESQRCNVFFENNLKNAYCGYLNDWGEKTTAATAPERR